MFFTHGAGTFTYVTQPLKTMPERIEGSDHNMVLEDGRIRLQVRLEEDEAKVVFFL